MNPEPWTVYVNTNTMVGALVKKTYYQHKERLQNAT